MASLFDQSRYNARLFSIIVEVLRAGADWIEVSYRRQTQEHPVLETTQEAVGSWLKAVKRFKDFISVAGKRCARFDRRPAISRHGDVKWLLSVRVVNPKDVWEPSLTWDFVNWRTLVHASFAFSSRAPLRWYAAAITCERVGISCCGAPEALFRGRPRDWKVVSSMDFYILAPYRSPCLIRIRQWSLTCQYITGNRGPSGRGTYHWNQDGGGNSRGNYRGANFSL